MFHAFVIICASSFNQIYTDTCFRLDDAWGPYITEENCYIRANQLKDEVLIGNLNNLIFDMFLFQYGAYPPQIYAEGLCDVSNEIES